GRPQYFFDSSIKIGTSQKALLKIPLTFYSWSFHQVAKTLEKWKAQILQYFLTPYTNNRIEGTNHKIKNIKRRSFGYRNPERFRLRVFLECTGTIYDQIA